MGGPSSEHEVSLNSGNQILDHIDRQKFSVFPVKIEKDGSWPMDVQEFKERFDIAFIAMHGEYGEDGQVQSLLETFGIPYTGSGPLASALAMDKEKAAAVLAANKIRTPEIITNAKNFQMPAVVKPVNLGSSVGVTIVQNLNDLEPAINFAKQHSGAVMIQPYIKGWEFTCGVLEINNTAVALVPTEIIPKKGSFFDFASKYEIGGSEEVTPPNISKEFIKLIQETALKTHRVFGCSGMSRTDMILGEDGKLYVLEINTIPGMTKTSLLPQQAAKMGIDFPHLLEIILQSGLNKGDE